MEVEKVKSELKYSKIIAFQIPSRHKRGKKKQKLNASDPKSFTNSYKVFVQYIHVDLEIAIKNSFLKPTAKQHHRIKSNIIII